MEALIEQILAQLSNLPEPKLRAVLHFVDDMKHSTLNAEVVIVPEEPLLAIAGIFSGEPLSAQAIEAELYNH